MKKHSFDKLITQLQLLLNEIAELKPEDAERFRVCKGRAARIVRALKRDFPSAKIAHQNPGDETAWRNGRPPDFGAGLNKK